MDFVRPDGSRTPVPGPGYGTVVAYGLDGLEVEQIMAPAGFQPVTATDEELAAFGFPPRPSDPDALADWNDTYSGYLGSAPPGLCRELALVANTMSTNWSGAVTTGTFDHAYGRVVVPVYSPTCGESAASAAWVGFGGTGSKLAQTGVYSAGTDAAVHAWFEMLNASTDSGMVIVSGLAPVAGQKVTPYVAYLPRNGSLQAYFQVQITGGNGASFFVQSVDGQPASQFYDPSTADFIVERPLARGAPLQLKRSGSYLWDNLWVAGSSPWQRVAQASTSLYTMQDSFGIELAGPDDGFTASNGFTDYWHACG